MAGRPSDEPLIEVMVRKDGKAYQKVKLGRGKVTFGRDEAAGVRLDSSHVSRIHFELEVEPGQVVVKDAGSRNGIRVGGQKTTRAVLPPRLIVTIPGFEIAYRWLGEASVAESAPGKAAAAAAPTPQQLGEELSAGWEKYLTEEIYEDEWAPREVTAKAKVPAAPEPAPAAALPREPSAPGSILNKLVQRRDTGDRQAPIVVADDPDADDGDARPDVPPLLLTLHEEGNALLYGERGGDLRVEVIETLGDQVRRMQQLAPGERYWWNGSPGLAVLWRSPNATSFPAVTYTREGEFHVQHPDDPQWKLFHRGQAPVARYKVGGFLACDAEWEDQVELSRGPVALYVRCVRHTPQQRPPVDWRGALPRRATWFAAWASALVHLGFTVGVAVLGPRLDTKPWLQERNTFVDARLYEEPSPQEPPAAPPEPEPAPPPPPEPSLDDLAKISAQRKSKRPAAGAVESPTAKVGPAAAPAPNKKPAPKEAPPPPAKAPIGEPPPRREEVVVATAPTRAPPPSVGVDDFKVTGLIGHLPELKLNKGDRGGGGRRILQGGKSTGVVTKGANLLGITPEGTLSKEQVSKVVNSHTREVMQCYESLVADDANAEGLLELIWVVETTGKVGQVRVQRDTVGLATLVQCVRKAIKEWVFPQPVGGAATVSYPFRFQRI